LYVMNFAFYVKDGEKKRALSPMAGDVLALMEALDILRGRWRNTVRFFFEDETQKRINFVYKLYYPILLVREGDNVIPIDGMNLHKMRVNDYLKTDRGYEVMNVRVYELPVVEEGEGFRLSEWIIASAKGEIDDGFALPPALQEHEARDAAHEFLRLLRRTEERATRIRAEIAGAEGEFKEALRQKSEDYARIESAYEEKIRRKRDEIEGLIADEERIITESRREGVRVVAELSGECRRLSDDIATLRKEIAALNEKYAECERRWDEARKELDRSEARFKEIVEKAGAERGAGQDRSAVQVEEALRGIEGLRKKVEALREEGDGMRERREQLARRLADLERELPSWQERERLITVREDLEAKRVRGDLARKRESLPRELLDLISERNRALLELKTNESRIKREYEREIGRMKLSLEAVEAELKRNRDVLIRDDRIAGIETLYIPFYLVSSRERLSVVEPPIVIRGGRAEESKGTGIIGAALRHIEGDWTTLSTLEEAREIFNVLSEGNRDRVLKGIEELEEIGALGRIQKFILLSRGSST